MDIIDLYEIAEKDKIAIKMKDFKGLEANGLCLCDNQKCKIYLNTQIETKVEEKCVLAEEIGHYKTGIAFNLLGAYNANYELTRSINEFRAKKWAVNEIIPFNVFKSYFGSNKSKFDIANELNVTEEFIDFAFFIYEPLLKGCV